MPVKKMKIGQYLAKYGQRFAAYYFGPPCTRVKKRFAVTVNIELNEHRDVSRQMSTSNMAAVCSADICRLTMTQRTVRRQFIFTRDSICYSASSVRPSVRHTGVS